MNLVEPEEETEDLATIRDLRLEPLDLLVAVNGRQFVFVFVRVLHAHDVEVRNVLEQSAKLVATFRCVKQIPDGASVLRKQCQLPVDRRVQI